MMRALLITIVLLTIDCTMTSERRHTAFVLVGGTGDLAAKYLWHGLFSVYQSHLGDTSTDQSADTNHTFGFLSAGRSPQERVNLVLRSVLNKSVRKCPEGPSGQLCKLRAEQFINKVKYVPLKDREDFTILCTKIQNIFLDLQPDVKKDVVLYLAISPSAYETVIDRFHERCATKLRQEKVSLAVGLEKPFGLDAASAKAMSQKTLSLFSEEEIYRVDHYLGKTVVKSILPFRFLNPSIESRLNKNHVERVEIFLKETVGVGDRFSVYNSMGVLRDVHQNHLTQLMSLVAMDLPVDLQDESQIEENKGHLLSQVLPVKGHNSLFGQYSGYGQEGDDNEGQSSQSGQSIASANQTKLQDDAVPTFAASRVQINSPRWHGVPFLLVSGKKLDTRESYVSVIFKSEVCVSHCSLHRQAGSNDDSGLCDLPARPSQLVFNLNVNEMPILSETILISKDKDNLKVACPTGLKHSSYSESIVYGNKAESFNVCQASQLKLAYESLFDDLFRRRRKHFVNTKHLILSWQIWDSIVKAPKDLVVYDEGDKARRLNFIIREDSLEFVYDSFNVKDDTETDKTEHGDTVVTRSGKATVSQHSHTAASFLGRKLVTSHTDRLAYLLARDIDRAAEEDISSKGSFHIAFAGGTSLPKVFRTLAQSFASGPHWPSVHIWQVDERCVPHSDSRSNWQSLDRELLRFTAVPSSNLHPMPVDCNPELSGDHEYTESIRRGVSAASFDFLVLGVGVDGHVASLFPGSPDLHVQENRYVVITEDGPNDTHQRMSFTLPLINRSRRVAMFVTGSHKQGIVGKLEEVGDGKASVVDKYPVLGVNPVNGTLTWYMDYESYMGVYADDMKDR